MQGVEEVEEPIETIEATIDYNAVWNESRGTWYIKVTVPDENLDAGSVKSIHAITEAGVDLDEPRELTPDTDTVMWFGVAEADGEVTLKADGEYAYKVVRLDDSEYIFNFTYASSEVQGVEKVTTPGKLEGATDYAGYNEWSAAITDNGIDFGQITKDQAIAMGLPDVDYYGIAMNLVVDGKTIDLNSENLTKVERVFEGGEPVEALVTADGTVQFVHNGWGEAGKYTMYYYLKDGRVVEAKINVVNFEFKSEEPVVVTGELVAATDYPSYENWKDAITEEGIDFGQITKDQAIAMGLPGVDYYGVAMYLEVDGEQVDLSADNLESVVRTDPAGGTTEPTVSGDNIYQFVHDGWGGPGEYTMLYTLKDGTIIEAKINVVSFEFKPVVLDGELVAAEDYTSYENWEDAITEDGIDFSKITQAQAIKMGIADPDYYGIAMYLKVGDDTIELNSDNLKSVVRIDPEGNEVEPQVTADNIYQFVHDGWGGPGEYTMLYTLKDGTIIEAKINVVSFEFKDEEPEVKEAEWKDTGKVGTNTIDGKAYVFQGFELLDAEGKRIDLVANNIESMTVLEPGASEPKTLTVGDDSDPLLWFNVQKATGDYKYTVVTKAGVTYVATLNWTAPVTVDVVKTGDPAYNQERENWYQLYTVEVDVDPEDSKVYQIKPDGEISELTVLADADNHLNIWFRLYGKDGEQQEGEHIFLIKKGDTWSKAVIDYGLVEVARADGDVTQDTGFTGGKSLEYDFVAEGKVLTIDAKNTKLPYYEEDGSYPPRGANWVGVAIPVPEGVDKDEVTATINGTECVDLFFAEGKYMEYIDVKDGDLTDNAATYTWVIKWGSGYADETITVKLINVAGLEAPEEEPEPANLVATGSYGIHDNKVYAGYELQDKDGTQIPLIESNIESISVKDPDGNVTELTVVGETDPYLWFNIAKEAGTYTYTVVTKGEECQNIRSYH
jgi:hypothetical protein